MKTAITGATGQLGRLVVQYMKQRNAAAHLVALVRTPEKASDLGFETRHFDYDQPATLEPALEGIEQLLLISGNAIGQRKEQHERVIKAAKAAGVRRIVYTSLLHADRSSLSLAVEHLATEQAIQASGMTYTILRNGWYTENYTGNLQSAIAAGALIGCAGQGRISGAPRKDYAEAAAVVLTTPGHDNAIYELAGDTAFTLTDLAAEVSKKLGKDIAYQDLTEAEYANVLTKAGLPAPLAAVFASFDTGAAKDDLFDDGRQLSSLIGRPTTPLSEVITL